MGILLFVAFLLGLSIGSFVNAWSFRYGTLRSILSPSACRHCGRRLAWYEIIPLASFIALSGKCRTCRAPISLQYPIVELIMGIVFLLVLYRVSDFSLLPTFYSPLFTHWIFWSILIAISVYDFRTKLIPNGGAFALAALGFLSPWLVSSGQAAFSWEHFVAGPLLALPLAAFWLFSRGRWMGLGDAKIELGIGWFLGLSLGLFGLFAAFWLGALIGVLLILASRFIQNASFSLKSELPFGPFLAMAAFLVWFFGFDITILVW